MLYIFSIYIYDVSWYIYIYIYKYASNTHHFVLGLFSFSSLRRFEALRQDAQRPGVAFGFGAQLIDATLLRWPAGNHGEKIKGKPWEPWEKYGKMEKNMENMEKHRQILGSVVKKKMWTPLKSRTFTSNKNNWSERNTARNGNGFWMEFPKFRSKLWLMSLRLKTISGIWFFISQDGEKDRKSWKPGTSGSCERY